MIRIDDRISIDERKLEERFIRASGPGGQNVNKLSTAVQLRFDVRHSPSLPAGVRARLERPPRPRRPRTRADPPPRGAAGAAPADQADRRIARAPAAIEKTALQHQGIAPGQA